MPIRLDLFQPVGCGEEFKVIVANKRPDPRDVIVFQEGWGTQEEVPAKFKTNCQMDYVTVGTLVETNCTCLSASLPTTLLENGRSNLPPRARGATAKRIAP